MAEGERVLMITEGEIKRSMADPGFYSAMPEFLPLKAKMAAMKVDPGAKAGCTPCAMRRAYNSLSGNYISTLSALSEDGKRRIREYFGASSLRATRIDPVTRRPQTVRI